MADIQQLIHTIVSDPKIATSSNFADKVYRDEPILFTIPQKEQFTPPRIREMRQLARRGGHEAKVFYEQAKFMESYEDDFDYKGEFSQYFPTYQAMSDAQVRGYFSWRTRVRRGIIGKTSLSYAFVYMYELLNQIGVSTPVDGFHALKKFCKAYNEIDPRINSYAMLWLKDYVVYNNFDKTLLDGLPDVHFDRAVNVLLEYQKYGMDDVFSALNALSSYNLEESRFFKQHPDEVKQVAVRVFSLVSAYYNKNPKKSAREKLFGRICFTPYSMFKSAVFYHKPMRTSFEYELGVCHRYFCENGGWSCERFVWYGNNNKHIGALLKSVDYLMRQAYGFKSTLLPGKLNKIIRGKIEKEIAAYLAEKKASQPKRIDIDVSKLHTIRASSLSIQNKLLVEEEEAEPIETAPVTPAAETGLDWTEHQFVRCLLHGGQYGELLQSRGLMVSVLIDSINEKLYERFNDTVIIDGADGPEVLEDYQEELKGMLAS